MLEINPTEVQFGQTPGSQFSAKRFLGGIRGGDWDREIEPIQSHPLYVSYVEHFQQGIAWEETPFFKSAMALIDDGKPFRDEYDSRESLLKRFHKCDRLHQSISADGYKSNRQLYAEGKIDNILALMDEVTVNIGRHGEIILNDGWHRFVSARLLQLPSIPVRLCATHALARKSR